MTAFLLVIGCMIGQAGPAHTSQSVTLRFNPPNASRFSVHRIWRANPANSGNGNQTDSIDVLVTRTGSDRGQLHLAFERYSPHQDKPISQFAAGRLPHLAPKVKQLRLVRGYAPAGGTTSWSFDGYNESEWAGMMASKACGLLEIGFLELHFPDTPVHVGSTWTATVHVGNEGLDGQGTMLWVKGNNPLCTYRLVSLDQAHNTAKLTFDLHTVVTGSFTSPFTHKPEKYMDKENMSGGWTLDLRSGMPIKFSAKRTYFKAGQPHTTGDETETTTTTVVRR